MLRFRHETERISTRLFKDLPLFIKSEAQEEPAIWEWDDARTTNASCISCADEPCLRLEASEIEVDVISGFIGNDNLRVCPVDAISWRREDEVAQIAADACIGCGLCMTRCPVGAIYMKDGAAKVSEPPESELETKVVSLTEAEDKNRAQIVELPSIDLVFPVRHDLDVTDVSTAIAGLAEEGQLRTVRNLFVQLGMKASVRRKGVSAQRIDGFFQGLGPVAGSIEIEYGADSLEAIRATLDDVAVIHCKYALDMEKQQPIVVFGELPTRRQGYWQGVIDMRNVLKIEVATFSVGSLLLLLWNHEKLTEEVLRSLRPQNDSFTIRRTIEAVLDRSVSLPQGAGGILEPRK